MTERTFAPDTDPVRVVTKPSDRAERDADRAADDVVRGRSVTPGLLTGQSIPIGSVHRKNGSGSDKKAKTDEKNGDAKEYKEAAKTTLKAISKTKAVKDLTDRVQEAPEVKKVIDAVKSPAGLITAGVLGAGAVTVLALADKGLPFQPPAIPLDFITPGLSAQAKVIGSLRNPDFVGLTISFKPKRKNKNKGDDDAQVRPPEPDPFTKARNKAEEERLSQMAIEYVVAQFSQRSNLGGIDPTAPGLVLPLLPPRADTERPEGPVRADEPVKRSAETQVAPSAGTTVDAKAVDTAVAGSGRSLDPRTRQKMETRFGHDFSAVRIHDDAGAANAASAIDAAAFTIGNDIAFGPGRFSQTSPSGLHLLAHELAHIVQQDRTAGVGRRGADHPPVVWRRDFFESVGIFLGIVEGNWTDEELGDYLTQITEAGEIDGAYDADNKARAIVARWKNGDPDWNLTPDQKVLLIQEMLDGPTLGKDENAILDLLELSDAHDLRAILRQVDYGEIESDINGAERDRLHGFVASRFRGGRTALLAGRVQVEGDPVPANAPNFGFSEASLQTRVASRRRADEIIAVMDRYPGADLPRALEFLRDDLYPRQQAQLEAFETAQQTWAERIIETEPGLADQVNARIRGSVEAQRNRTVGKTEQILHHYLAQRDPQTESELLAGTTAATATQAAEISRVLSPQPSSGSAEARPEFVETLPDETQSYSDKMAAALADEVDEMHRRLVTHRGPTEHADPAQVRPLAFFEQMANTARDETLAVFGSFLNAPAPPFTAHSPVHPGNLRDQFTEIETHLAQMTAEQRRAHAKGHAHYLLRAESWSRAINRAHYANPRFDENDQPQNDEATHLDDVAGRFAAVDANVMRMNEIYRNWPGRHRREGDGTRLVYIQIFRDPDRDLDRFRLWKVFKTLVHEYLHALTSDPYYAHAQSLGRGAEYNTLIEGTTSLLTEIVWSRLESRVGDRALRQIVEPDYIGEDPIPETYKTHLRLTGRYPSYAQAVALQRVVGIDAIYAAYFLGRVDRIGGP